MPSMTQQAEYSTAKLGDHCPLCDKGALVISPSGLNLHCDTCHQITVLPPVYRPDARPNATRREPTPGRPRGAVKKREIRMASVLV